MDGLSESERPSLTPPAVWIRRNRGLFSDYGFQPEPDYARTVRNTIDYSGLTLRRFVSARGRRSPAGGPVPCQRYPVSARPASWPARRVAGRAGRDRVRRPGHAAVQEPVRRRHAAHDPQPEPALRPALAEARLGELGIPLGRKAGKMSGGQQAQLALTLALARRPQLLVLDEPMAMLDPLARHDFMATVMTAIADDGVSGVLSSHVLAELERGADYLVLVSRGNVQVAGKVDDLLARHRVLTGPATEVGRYAERLNVVHARRGEVQAHLLVRTNATTDPVPPGWEAHPVGLEELTLAYVREPDAAALPGLARAEDAKPTEVTK